jgi:FAD synthetase
VPKKNNKITVLAGGCFDILHYGHIHYLKESKKHGTHLVVAIESDANIRTMKGVKRPFHPQAVRKEILEYLTFVDEVIILKDKMKDEDYLQMVMKVAPDIITVTEGDPILEKKKSHAKKAGAKLIEIKKVKTSSTSEIAGIMGLE